MSPIPQCPKCGGNGPRVRFLVRSDGVPVISYTCWDCMHEWEEVNPVFVQRNFPWKV